MSRPGTPRDQVLARLRDLERSGVDGLPRARRRADAPRGGAASGRGPAAPGAPPADAGSPAAWTTLGLEALGAVVQGCTACKLSSGRTKVVFGTGPSRARLMFIGEGPGRDEDLQGEPFVGRAGKLLTEMIERGMGLARADVYIANVVKCRPPENREPEPDEVAACEGYLRRQVELVDPEVIVTLGRVATQAVLKTTARLGSVRGQWQEVHGRAVLPTFHPAYLLRNPGEKRLAWGDLKLVMVRLGMPVPAAPKGREPA